MGVFLFQVMPVLSLAVLVFSMVLLFRGTMKASRRMRLWGMILVAVFVLMLSTNLLLALARM